MSQSGPLAAAGVVATAIKTLTGNSGGAVGPDGSNNVNILGANSSGINIIGVPASFTLNVSAYQSSTTQFGTIKLATNAQAIAGSDTNNAVTSAALAAKLGTQTAHSLAVFEGTSSALTALGSATNGQIPIGSTGADPVLANITSSAGTIVVTNGAGTINLDIAGGHSAIEEFLPDSGTSPVVPNGSGQITMAGSGSITTVGGLNSLTTELTGLTNHAVLVGAGTTTITKITATANTGAVLQNNSGADPSYSTATYPSTTTINQLLYSSAANTVGGLTTANNGVLTTGTSGTPVITALASDGQLIIGSSAGAPAAATITAGNGISVTNGHNTITIAATGSEQAWTDEGVSFNAAVGNGYFITANATATMPASPSQGNIIEFIVDAAATLTIQANTGQVIRIGAAASAAAGTAANNARGDAVTLIYRSADTTWLARSVTGTWTVT